MARGGGPVTILLHLNHLVLAIVIIIGLHFYGQMYDLSYTLDRWDDRNKEAAAKEKLAAFHGEGHSGNGDASGASGSSFNNLNGYPQLRASRTTTKPPAKPEKLKHYPTLWCTGAIWAIIAGIFGIAALGVLIASFFLNLPKWVQWYYLVAAILILFFASLGLGLNVGVTAYEDCLHLSAAEEKILKVNPKLAEALLAEDKKRRTTINCYGQYGGGGYFYLNDKGFPIQDGNDFSSPIPRFPIFFISVLLAMAYIASFLLKFFDDSSSVGSSGGRPSRPSQGQQDRDMREQQARENQMREQEAKDKDTGSQNPAATNDGKPKPV